MRCWRWSTWSPTRGISQPPAPTPLRRDLVLEAEWLATLLTRLMPEELEPLGLLALIRLHLARWPARLDASGRLVLLWDRRAIGAAIRLIERAAARRRPGRYQVEAAIAAVRCEAPTWEDIDWCEVADLYTLLLAIDPSPVVRLNQAIAVSHVDGPATALAEPAGGRGPSQAPSA